MRLGLRHAIAPLALFLVFCEAGADGQDTTSTGDTESSGNATGGNGSGGGGGIDSTGPGSNPTECPGIAQSYIWIANTGESTLSKVCTITGEEVARYATSPQAGGDPSRTSVNLHGDAVVTNRSPSSGGSSVTKFAANPNECPDRNNNGQVDTSTGPTDVLPWGEDECMIWNVALDSGDIGARATAWDGTEDPETGEGGNIFIGAINGTVFKIDGDDGSILESANTGLQHYGGAIDNAGNFWTVDMLCTVGQCTIQRMSLDDFTDRSTHAVHCGYGISVDSKGRIWTAGGGFEGCVARFDPATNTGVHVITGGLGDFNRGVAIGIESSAGYAWAANTVGDLIQVDLETVEIVNRQNVGGGNMIGVAIDFEGFVWTVSQDAGATYKIDPVSWQVTPVQIGSQPYTYSDMTGIQLKGVIDPPK